MKLSIISSGLLILCFCSGHSFAQDYKTIVENYYHSSVVKKVFNKFVAIPLDTVTILSASLYILFTSILLIFSIRIFPFDHNV